MTREIVRLTLDFTLEKYEHLCRELLDSDMKVMRLSSYLEERPRSNFVILRHDVDRKPINALRMAQLEKKMEINSTYYFRYINSVFKPEIIRSIQKLGHEVGYHYEVLSRANGNYEEALRMFESELREFRKICEVKTICMHGSPLSKYDNRDLWKIYDFKEFGILGEAYLSVEEINYFSDTGRTWSPRNKLRDVLKYTNVPINQCALVENTDDLLDLIKSGKENRLYLLAHPERWASNSFEWLWYHMKDIVFNIGKKIVRHK